MTLEIILVIAGALLLVAALLGSLTQKESSSAIIDAKIRIPLGFIGILLLIYGGYSYGSIHTMAQIEQFNRGKIKVVEYPVDRTQIISPVEGDAVDCRVLAMGVYPEPHDKDIWVLLRPSDEKYYPQSDHTNTSYKRNGEWQVITRFGGDEGETYDIIVYEADAAASAFFTDTIQRWKDALSYPGLESDEIPAGAVEVDRIVVTLQKNCRGVF
jgi:hypothetical protein